MLEITEAQYESLLRLAKVGAAGLGEETQFLVLRDGIDRANNIKRYVLLVRWQSLPARAPVAGDPFPPGETRVLELTRKPTLQDVKELLQDAVYTEELVMVTADPSGKVGWHLLNDYPF